MKLIADEFYPTPYHIALQMLSETYLTRSHEILEPSAGRGDLVDAIHKCVEEHSRYDKNRNNVDVIEIDDGLRNVLRGKGERVVHDDFLTFATRKRYDFIIMNPPFSNGDEHLLYALKFVKQGGTVICLLNEETLLNPYTNRRKQLKKQLDGWNADIGYLGNVFHNADRPTGVGIALVKVNRPEEQEGFSILLDDLKRDEQKEQEKRQADNWLIDSDPIQAAIQQYRFEEKAGLNLIREYEALLPYMKKSLVNESYTPLIEIKTTPNTYVEETRYKYWEALFAMPEFTKQLTRNLYEKLNERLDEFRHYDFTEVNILALQAELSRNVIAGVKDTIMHLFDELSYKHSWSKDSDRNTHYFDGWKTNKAWKINKKVIIPLNLYGSYGLNEYETFRRVNDIEKCLDFLNGNKSWSGPTTDELLRKAKDDGQFSKVQLRHIEITFYKKGTSHIVFRDDELLERFNAFGCNGKGWLPPNYGKKSYRDMNQDEKDVIDSFQGESAYESFRDRGGMAILNDAMPLALTKESEEMK